MEDYKQKYEQALERCKKEFNFNNLAYSHEEIKQRLERVFPELKESDDERIRKSIIDLVEKQMPKSGNKKWMISWLEKQGELIEKYEDKLDRCACSNFDKGYKAALEKQGEQKPSDKVKPKFKVGDWITNGGLLVGQVTSFDGEYYHYICEGIEQSLHISNANNWHLWTIQDAKDGDMIYVSTEEKGIQAIFKSYDDNYIYFHCYLCQDFNVDGWLPIGDIELIYPLQKIHYNRFFQKMKEAGYKWDAEKKELKKIEQKSAWSEEDKRYYNSALWHIKNSCRKEGNVYIWLKSLKDRVQS